MKSAVTTRWRRAWRGPAGIGELLPLALPIIVTQGTDTLLLFCDRWLLAHHSTLEMSCSMSGGLTAFTIATFFIGLMNGVNALAGQYHGGRRRYTAAAAAGQGLWLSFAAWPLLLALSFAGPWIFRLCGHSQEQVELETQFFQILVAGHIFTLIRADLSSFFSAIGRPEVVMRAALLALVINLPLAWLGINGCGPLPGLGIAGAGLATVISGACACVYLWMVYRSAALHRSHRTRRALPWRWPLACRVWRYGWPGGVEFFLHIAGFNAFILFFHAAGPAIADAVTITFSWELIAFLPMVGLHIAVISAAARHIGAGRPRLAARAASSGLFIGLTYALTMSLIFLCLPDLLVRVFDSSGTSPGTMELARTLLRLCTIYLAADVIHLVLSGVLKGAGDVLFCAFVSSACMWFIALSSWWLIRSGASPVTVWLVFVGGVLLIACIYTWRFLQGRWRSMRMTEERAD